MTTYGRVEFSEFHSESVGLIFKVEKILLSKKSKFQDLMVFETKSHGRVLTLDGLVMVTEKDEFIYHEMIAHVPLYSHPNPKKVLIIGGGDGGTAREVLRHKSIEQVDMVEIDEEVINASKEFLPTMSVAFKDSRLNLIIGDGVEFVKDKKDEYDVIIIDSTDPISIGEGLFTRKFYSDCKKALKEGGILVNQSESPFYDPKWVEGIYDKLNDIFKVVKSYTAFCPTYPAIWSFGYCLKDGGEVKFNEEAYKSDNLEFKYYNKDIHFASFSLPTFMKKIVYKGKEWENIMRVN